MIPLPSFPFNFVSVKASNSNFPFWKMSTTSSLFVVSFIPLKFHVPKRLTKFRRVIQGGSRRYLLLRPRLADAFVERRNRVRAPNKAPQTIWLTLTTLIDHTVDLFCSRYTRTRIEGVKEVYVYSKYYVVRRLRYVRRRFLGSPKCLRRQEKNVQVS